MAINSRWIAIIVVVNVIVVILILFCLIIHYKKYKKLKKDTKVNITDQKRGDELGGQRGELVFLGKNATRFEPDDLFRASAEGLGKGSLGNCYKAMMEIGEAVVVKRLTAGLKGLSNAEFAHQDHPFLLPLLAYYYSKEEKLLLYPFAPGGNLYNRLHGIIYLYLQSTIKIVKLINQFILISE